MARKAGASGRQGRTDIELEISDFGPVARGKIALRPLTVFVGPNGSGKSYASVLAHSVILACADLAETARSGDWAEPLMESGQMRGLSARAFRLAASVSGRGDVAVPRGLSDDIHRCTVGLHFEGALVYHMSRNFGSPLGAMVRTGSRSSRIRIRGPISADVSISRRGEVIVRAGTGGTRYLVRGTSVVAAGAARSALGSRGKGSGRDGSRPPAAGPARRRDPGALAWLAAGIAEQAVADRACGPSKHLPAARPNAMQAHGVPIPGCLYLAISGMAGTALDLPGLLAGAGATRRNVRSRKADRITPYMFGGRLAMAGRGAGALSYVHGETSVPMHMSSSGIANTAPLELAAAGMGAGDTLVLEEPEAHLHPKSQVRLARHLVGLVRRGVRVILSTHSDFLLGQLDIFVKLGSLTPSKRVARGYEKGSYVGNDEVAPYAFAGSARKGYAISELEHSATDGIAYEGFMNVVESMAEDDYRIHLARGR